jgi:hypothetical protein
MFAIPNGNNAKHAKNANMKNAQILIDAMTPTVAEMTANFIVRENGRREAEATAKGFKARPVTAYEIELYSLGLQIDALKAFGRYIMESDAIEVSEIKTEAGVIVFDVLVTRDGQTERIVAEVIHAGGYNIQCLHLRYILKTNLRSLQVSDMERELLAKRKRMTAEQKIAEDRERATKYFNRDIARHDAEAAMTFEQFRAEHYAATWTFNPENNTGTREAYELRIADIFDRDFTEHKRRCSALRRRLIVSDYEKQMKKLDAKAAKLTA